LSGGGVRPANSRKRGRRVEGIRRAREDLFEWSLGSCPRLVMGSFSVSSFQGVVTSQEAARFAVAIQNPAEMLPGYAESARRFRNCADFINLYSLEYGLYFRSVTRHGANNMRMFANLSTGK